MNYTPKFFKDTMPDWKKKKDPPLSRIFYRPMGFALAAVFANAGFGANAVSYISVIEGVLACVLFLPNHYICRIIGAILVNLWLVLDCTDGCIARSVKSEPFGEFADGISSYIMVALIGPAVGMAAYYEGGVLLAPGSPWIILIGALASVSDSLMRLIYQKYKATEREEADRGTVKVSYDQRKDPDQVGSLRVKIEQDLGIGGILPIMFLFGTIFHTLDIVVFYMFAYYGFSCLVITMIYIRKTIKAGK